MNWQNGILSLLLIFAIGIAVPLEIQRKLRNMFSAINCYAFFCSLAQKFS